jgi:hypothetical protein
MKLHFEFTEAEAQIILNALAGRPYGEVAQLIQVFQSQAAQQLSAQPAPPAQPPAAND